MGQFFRVHHMMKILIFSLGILVILYNSEARLHTFVPEPIAEYEIRRVWEEVDRPRRILETKKEENQTIPRELLGGVNIKANVTKSPRVLFRCED